MGKTTKRTITLDTKLYRKLQRRAKNKKESAQARIERHIEEGEAWDDRDELIGNL